MDQIGTAYRTKLGSGHEKNSSLIAEGFLPSAGSRTYMTWCCFGALLPTSIEASEPTATMPSNLNAVSHEIFPHQAA